jgi:GMP synthase-like glutamine amidotransferase
MKLCLLENDELDGELGARYDRLGAMFKRLFADAGADWTIEVFNTYRGEYPASFDDYDAVLLSGSKADSYSQESWVQALRQKVSELLQQRKKLMGVCFGHQLIASCLGAKVGRAPQGWGAGSMKYQWHDPQWPAAQGRTDITLLASHQDQVLELPAGATLLASNDFCPVAAFAVGTQVLCVQPHPEFVEDFSAYLLNKRRAILGETLYHAGSQSLAQGHEGVAMARMMVAFVERP